MYKCCCARVKIKFGKNVKYKLIHQTYTDIKTIKNQIHVQEYIFQINCCNILYGYEE